MTDPAPGGGRPHDKRRARTSAGSRCLTTPTIFWVFVASVLLAFASAGPVHAQDSQLNEVRITAGPHDVVVIPVNTNLAAGFVQYSVLVRNAKTGGPVSDAKVVLLANHEDEDYEGWANALNSPALPEQYDARLNLDSTGKWLISVDVISPLGRGGGEVQTLEVPSLQRYTSGSMVFFGVFAVLLAGVAYVWWSARRDRRRHAAQG